MFYIIVSRAKPTAAKMNPSVSAASAPTVQPTLEAARKEACRLAGLYQDKTFIVMGTIEGYETESVPIKSIPGSML